MVIAEAFQENVHVVQALSFKMITTFATESYTSFTIFEGKLSPTLAWSSAK